MELVASLPPDLAAIADPTARAAAPPLRPADPDDTAAAASAPFELLLGLLAAPLPGGETLPPPGNALPAAPVATGADLLARLKLAAPPTANVAPPPPQPWSSADAVAQVSQTPIEPGLLPTNDAAAAGPLVAPLPAAAGTSPPAAADLAAALEAALPRTSAEGPAPRPLRTALVRDSERGDAQRAAAVATERSDIQARVADSPAPVAQVADAHARPARRDSIVQAFVLPEVAATGDAAASAAGAPPALSPAQPHAAPLSGSSASGDTPAQLARGAAIDTRADNWHEALASRVHVLVDQHVGEAHIKLNPPELGAVDIKISLVDDKTFVQLTAGTSAARDELAQSLPKLRELLSASGLSLGGASVQSGSAGQGGYDVAPRVAVPLYAPFTDGDDDEVAPARHATRAAGRIDLFA